MKELHPNFKIIRCGLFINEEYPWLHGTPDFLCSCVVRKAVVRSGALSVLKTVTSIIM